MTGCLMIATLIIMHSAYLCCWNRLHAHSHYKCGFTVGLGQSQESWPGHLVCCCFYIYQVTSRSLLGHFPLWRSGWRRAVNLTPLLKMVNVYHKEEENFLVTFLLRCRSGYGEGVPVNTVSLTQKHELALRLYLASTPTTTSIAEHKTLAKLKKKQI